MRIIKLFIKLGFILLFVLPTMILAQDTGLVLSITPEDLKDNKELLLDTHWRYKAGDDLAWAKADFDDTNWDITNKPRFKMDKLPKSGWGGIGWFRLHIKLDPSLVKEALSLSLQHYGASEIYIDGKLFHSFGQIPALGLPEKTSDPVGVPISLKWSEATEHVIAIRFSNQTISDTQFFAAKWWESNRFPVGVAIGLQNMNAAVNEYFSDRVRITIVAVATAGFLSSLAFLHLLLFIFYKEQRANLFYSIFAFSIVMTDLVSYTLAMQSHSVGFLLFAISLSKVLQCLLFISFTAFLYSAFYASTSKYFKFICWGWLLTALICVGVPSAKVNVVLFFVAITLTIPFLFRIITRAIIKKQDGVWIIGVGLLGFVFHLTMNLLIYVFEVLPRTPATGRLSLGFFYILPLSVSVYLARNFAQVSKNLTTQLVQVKELSEKQIAHQRREAELLIQSEKEQAKMLFLEAENDRKAKELEEARQLQLSMLPKHLPKLPNIEIAAYMKTATEVGGDYYDFYVADDGTLIVAIGDATGHGLKASTVVTATKSLFRTFVNETNLVQVLKQSSGILKEMNLRRLYMALMVMRIKDNHARFSAAGMPPMLVYRALTKKVEVIPLQGMPLGSAAFPYKEQELTLHTGDTVALMSDGFPELFNPAGEMFDYEHTKQIFLEVAERSPDEIIAHFTDTIEKWSDGRSQDDDITFVVLKIKDPRLPITI